MRGRTILVTGGAGFIGSHVVEALVSARAEVRVVDNLSTGREANLSPEATFFQGDILDNAVLESSLPGADTVVHLAARVAVRDSMIHYHDDARTNLMGTLNLMRHCGVHGVRRFLFASSMAVYADPGGPEPMNENCRQEPAAPYGLSKLVAEKYVRMLAPRMGMKAICLRYFNVYGPRQVYTHYVGVITIFIDKLLRRTPPVIFGDGTQQRDFVSVHDVTRATLLALESDLDLETFNVGSGRGTSVNEVARLLISILQPHVEPLYESSRPGEIRHSVADISRIRDLLGFEPQENLADGIAEVIRWKQQAVGRSPEENHGR